MKSCDMLSLAADITRVKGQIFVKNWMCFPPFLSWRHVIRILKVKDLFLIRNLGLINRLDM